MNIGSSDHLQGRSKSKIRSIHMHWKKGYKYTNSINRDKTPQNFSSGSTLFVKINSLLVIVDYKNEYAQLLIHFALISDKSSKRAIDEVIPTSSEILSKFD